MYRTGHYGISLLVYAPFGLALVALGLANTAVWMGGAILLLTPLPDIDVRLPLITHRGSTHTVLFGLLGGGTIGCLMVAMGRLELVLPGVFVGLMAVGSHILGDALTPAGVRPLWPFSDAEYNLARIPAASAFWNILLLCMGIGVIVAGIGVLRALGVLLT